MKAQRAGRAVLGLVVTIQVTVAALMQAHAWNLRREAERQAESLPRVVGVGAVMAVGGGGSPQVVHRTFLDLAGGPRARVVVVPTASEGSDGPDLNHYGDFLRSAGAVDVVVLHARSRAQANEPAFLKPLDSASGVWFSGGFQARLADTYLGTRFEIKVREVVQRGGVVAGTSAGASFLARVMILKGITHAETGAGMDLIPDVLIDQHFLQRNRFHRLLGVLAEHPRLLGLGIDEGTAAVIRGERLDVVGRSFVIACALGESDRGLPRITALKHGDGLNLGMLRGMGLARRPTSPTATPCP